MDGTQRTGSTSRLDHPVATPVAIPKGQLR
jgi:hypothetical protein